MALIAFYFQSAWRNKQEGGKRTAADKSNDLLREALVKSVRGLGADASVVISSATKCYLCF